MKKNKLRSIDAIRWRITVLALVLWLLCMILTTWGVAMDLYRQLELSAQREASMWADHQYNSQRTDKNAPGYADYCRILSIQNFSRAIHIYPRFFPQSTVDAMMGVGKGHPLPVRTAISYSYNDGDRSVKLSSAQTYDCLGYITEAQWEADALAQKNAGYLYIDRSKLDETYGNAELSWIGVEARRLTGWFEGSEFHLVTAETVTRSFDWSKRDRLRWETIYECPTPPGQAVVTVYCVDDSYWPYGMATTSPFPVTIDGTEYAQLEDVLPTVAEKTSLTDAVVRGYGDYEDSEGNFVHVRIALWANPLGYTIDYLSWFYLLTLALVLLAVRLILRGIRRNLTDPAARIADCFAAGMKPLDEKLSPRWKEGWELEQHYDAAATAYHETQTKSIQLQTALDYAHHAEEHRRKMISGITHELKTPLAVIHSYAEGLAEGIAADKQEQYLKIILDETERMDGMVLQMLDLSRLEAGKVRLSADQFSLLELTRSVFDRLSPIAEEKGLSVHYTLAEDFLITADESRMEQVITNFATNAIKYTPDDGNIWLRIYRHEGKANFILTNECPPLPADALEQVWDSFYRVEESRTTKGTGLGLSIARAIIELHGGTVQAQNTSEGVEFQFILP